MATLLPNKLTPLSPDEATAALAAGYKTVTGDKPSKKILALLVGQWAIETGNGKYIHNFNFGNQKHSSADEYYQEFQGSEVINGQNQTMTMQFAAYPDAASGAAAYIAQLKRRPHWWAGLKSGDAPTFIEALSTPPVYFTANPETYLKGVEHEIERYMPLVKKYAASGWGAVVEVVLGLVMGAGAVYAWRNRPSAVGYRPAKTEASVPRLPT